MAGATFEIIMGIGRPKAASQRQEIAAHFSTRVATLSSCDGLIIAPADSRLSAHELFQK
jgi:hypothetical protein